MIPSVLLERLNRVKSIPSDRERFLRTQLGEAHRREAMSVLTNAIAEPRDSQIAAMAAVAMGSQLDGFSEHVFEAITETNDPWAARRLVFALGWACNAEAQEVLADLSTCGEPRLRELSVFVLGQVALKANATLVISRLEDSDEPVRQMAAFILGWSGGQAVAGMLERRACARQPPDRHSLLKTVLAYIKGFPSENHCEIFGMGDRQKLSADRLGPARNIDEDLSPPPKRAASGHLGPSPDRAVFLTGFSASGKSSLARAVSKALGVHALDTDSLLSAQHGRSIPSLISIFGEEGFRQLESRLLENVCRQLSSPTVVATGGGAPLSRGNRALMQQAGITVFLDIEAHGVMSRLQAEQKEPRSCRHPVSNLLGFPRSARNIGLLVDFRRPYYGLADIEVSVTNRNIESIVREICVKLRVRASRPQRSW